MGKKQIKKLKNKAEKNKSIKFESINDNIINPQRVFNYEKNVNINVSNNSKKLKNHSKKLNSSSRKLNNSSKKLNNNLFSSNISKRTKSLKSKGTSTGKNVFIISLVSVIGILSSLGVAYGTYIYLNGEKIYIEGNDEITPAYNFDLPTFPKPTTKNGDEILSTYIGKKGKKSNKESSGIWTGKVNATYDLEDQNILENSSLFGISKKINDRGIFSDYLYIENISTNKFNDVNHLFKDYKIKEDTSASVDKYIWLKDTKDQNIEIEYIENLVSTDIDNNKIYHTSFILSFYDLKNKKIKIKFEKIGDYSAKASKGKLFNPNFFIWDEKGKQWIDDVTVDQEGNEYLGKEFEQAVEDFKKSHNDKDIDYVINELFTKIITNSGFKYNNNDILIGTLLPEFNNIDTYKTYKNKYSGNSVLESSGIWHGEYNSTYDDSNIISSVNEFGINWIDNKFYDKNNALFLRNISTPNYSQEYSNIFKVDNNEIINISNNVAISIENIYYLYDHDNNVKIEYIDNLTTNSNPVNDISFSSLVITVNYMKENQHIFEYKDIYDLTNSSFHEIYYGIYDEYGFYDEFTNIGSASDWINNDFEKIVGISLQNEINKIIEWSNENLFYDGSESSSIEEELITIDQNNQFMPPEDTYVDYWGNSNQFIDEKSTGIWKGQLSSNRGFEDYQRNVGRTYEQNTLFGVPLLSDYYVLNNSTDVNTGISVIRNAENDSYKNNIDGLIDIVDKDNNKKSWDEIEENPSAKFERYVGIKSNLQNLKNDASEIDWSIEIELIDNFEIETKDNGTLHMNSISIRRIPKNYYGKKGDYQHEKFVYKKLWNDKKMETFIWKENISNLEVESLTDSSAREWINKLLEEINENINEDKIIKSLNDLFNNILSEKIHSWNKGTSSTFKHNELKVKDINKPPVMNHFENSNNILVNDDGNPIYDENDKEQKLYDHIEGKFQSTTTKETKDLNTHSLFGPKTVKVVAAKGHNSNDVTKQSMIYYEDIKIEGYNDKVFGEYFLNFGSKVNSTVGPSMLRAPDNLNNNAQYDNYVFKDKNYHNFADKTLLDVTIDSILQMEVQGGNLFVNKNPDSNYTNSFYLTVIKGFKGENDKGDKFEIDFAITNLRWDAGDDSKSYINYQYAGDRNTDDLFNDDDFGFHNAYRKWQSGGVYARPSSQNAWHHFNFEAVDHVNNVFTSLIDYRTGKYVPVGVNYYVLVFERAIYSNEAGKEQIRWKYKDWEENEI